MLLGDRPVYKTMLFVHRLHGEVYIFNIHKKSILPDAFCIFSKNLLILIVLQSELIVFKIKQE